MAAAREKNALGKDLHFCNVAVCSSIVLPGGEEQLWVVGPYALLALLACERLSKSEPIITIVVVACILHDR